jgi:hypothetical protein
MVAIREGPATIELSARRRGILDRDLETRLLSRRRPAPGEDSEKASA